MNTCGISVIIPTQNRLEKLCRTLRSVDLQSYRDFEVWLVDDGSTDGTREFLESGQLAHQYSNIPTVHILLNEVSRGAAAARNQALARSAGKLIAFLDDDDVWMPDYLEWQSERMAENPAAACCARHIEVGPGGREREPDLRPLFEYEHPLVRLLSESFIHSMSVFVCRKAVFDAIGLLKEDLAIVHDWEWYARLLLSGNSILLPEGPVLVRREVPGGLVAKYHKWHEEEMRVLNRYLAGHHEFSGQARQAVAHRALLFARVGLEKKDYVFAMKRLIDALWNAPLRSMKIVTLRMSRNLRASNDRDNSGVKRAA